MPRSAPGSSEPPAGLPARRGGGFTLIELMVVVALIAIAAGVASLALRDSRVTRLDREAARLSALLETARAEARVAGRLVQFRLTPGNAGQHFVFTGLPASRTMPTRWLDDEVVAQIGDDRASLVLGPEALIGRQRVVLSIDDQRVEIATDGLQPFTARAAAADGRP
ncbi:MAG: putative ral secretion pathway protein GspH [Pseudomonadota bacterium]|jgi:general secretion pathway protein H